MKKLICILLLSASSAGLVPMAVQAVPPAGSEGAATQTELAPQAAGYFVWYKCPNMSRWHVVGPYTEYDAASAYRYYVSNGCAAFITDHP